MTPPPAARRFLILLLPKQSREFIVGDLDEEFDALLRDGIRVRDAKRWYWRQALSSLLSVWQVRSFTKRRMHTYDQKTQSGTLRDIASDLRFAFRSFARAPTFFFSTTGALALGIGATTAIFSVVDTVLWRPLPYPDADQIAVVGATFPNGRLAPVSPPMFFDWQEQNRSFESMAGIYRHQLDVTGRAEPLRLRAAGVSATFAQVFGLQPEIGRWFRTDEDEPGAARVVMLGNGAWRTHWAANPDILGETLVLNGESYTVVGVLPLDFEAPEALGLTETDIWFPMVFIPEDLSSHANWFIRVVGRLRNGVTLPAARDDMQSLTIRLQENYPSTFFDEEPQTQVRSLRELTVGDSETTFMMLLGAVSLLLLIACANVANLILARSNDRDREVAVRAALGAGRWRIVRQFLTESICLSATGGTVGVLLAIGAVRSLHLFNPGDWPRLTEVTVDARVLMFALIVSVLTGLLFGSTPALKASRPDLNRGLRHAPASARALPGNGTRYVLTVVETSLALVLLIGAGLLMNSFIRLNMVDPGFSTANVSVTHLSLSSRYETKEQRAQMFEQVLAQMEIMPNVESVGFSNGLPFGGGGMMGSFLVEDQGQSDDGRYVPWQLVSAGYFETLRITAQPGGRLFSETESSRRSNVVVVNETFARDNWPGESPVGRRLKVIATDQEDPWLTVVGVIPDIKQGNLARPSLPEVYVPYAQPSFLLPSMDFVVRASGPLSTVTLGARDVIWSIDPDQPIDWQSSLDDRISDSVTKQRFYLVLFAGFALVAVSLAAVGIYGVVTYTVERRTRELGIRLALGGSSARVVGMIVRQNLILISAGVIIGVFTAVFLGHLLSNLLFGITAVDVSTFAGAALILTSVGLVAGFIPARRVSRLGITETLRTD